MPKVLKTLLKFKRVRLLLVTNI